MTDFFSIIINEISDYMTQNGIQPNIVLIPEAMHWDFLGEINPITGITTMDRLRAMLRIPDNTQWWKMIAFMNGLLRITVGKI